MKLSEIYNRINETLDGKPLAYKKVSNTQFNVFLDGNNTIQVRLYHKTIESFSCISVLFVNPNSADPFALTNYFNGPGAVRIFTTIVDIIEPYNPDIIAFIPVGTDIEVENKKAKLYRVIAHKLQLMGKITGLEEINLNEFDKPIFVGLRGKASSLDYQHVEDVVKQFGISKFT